MKMNKCPDCNGTGEIPCDNDECVAGQVDCDNCDGSGEATCRHCGSEVEADDDEDEDGPADNQLSLDLLDLEELP